MNAVACEVLKAVVCLSCLWLAGVVAKYLQRPVLRPTFSEILMSAMQLVFMYRINLTTGMMRLFPITPNLYDFYGVQSDDFKESGLETISYIHPDDRQDTNIEVYKCIADKKPFQMQTRAKGPGGKYHWIRATSSFVRNEGDVSVWLGVIDDISDLRHLCDELDSSRAMARALERILASSFHKLVYVDANMMVCSDLPQGDNPVECIADWFVSDSDKALLAVHVSNALMSGQKPLPVMMEADIKLGGEEVTRKQVYIVNMQLVNVRRVLIGLRVYHPLVGDTIINAGTDNLIEIPIEGEVTDLVGYFYAILDEANRAKFAAAWKRRVVEECLGSLEYTRVGNLNILTPASEPLSSATQPLTAVYMFVALASLANLPVVDRVSVYMHASERCVGISDKNVKARAAFYLAMSAMKLTDESIGPRVISHLFDAACAQLAGAEVDDALTMLTLIKFQRGLYTWRNFDSPQESLSWLVNASTTDDRSLPITAQIKAVIRYDAFILYTKMGTLKAAQMNLHRLHALVVANPTVTFDPVITAMLAKSHPTVVAAS
jgi:PAS domain S-box-containing protein